MATFAAVAAALATDDTVFTVLASDVMELEFVFDVARARLAVLVVGLGVLDGELPIGFQDLIVELY